MKKKICTNEIDNLTGFIQIFLLLYATYNYPLFIIINYNKIEFTTIFVAHSGASATGPSCMLKCFSTARLVAASLACIR